MGMLDDAIREHLELKRLRGADPSEVARQEHDALAPVRRRTELPHEEEAGPQAAGDEPAVEAGASALDVPDADGETAGGGGQETAELDMDRELTGESPASEPPAPQAAGRAAPVGHPAHTQPSSDESLEWEMPGDRVEAEAGEESAGDGQETDGEPVEDVLEETPDFLRETPEQERLWFEQRPPRDFDFNE
jgi:hypothetical protein